MKNAAILLKNRLINKSFADIRLKEITDFEKLSLDERIEIQQCKLEKLLVHAAAHTAYYAELFENLHIMNEGKVDLDLFQQIPILEKGDIRNHFQQLASDDLKQRRWYKNRTGGSTGEPLEFIQDQFHFDCGMAMTQLQFQWAGKKSADTHVKLWGSQEDMIKGSLSTRSKLGNWFSKRILLNCFLLDPDKIRKYLQIIQQEKSVFIEAYADVAYEISRFINKNGIVLHNITGMITSAGTLYPFMCEEIETAFGCRVTNRYGSRDLGNMACEKEPLQGLHVSMFTHLIEVVDKRGEPCRPGEEGEVIVTSLINYSMPFIRYRIGDLAVVKNYVRDSKYNCELLESVTGRLGEVFRKKDGGVVSSAYFIHFLGVVNYKKWLEKFQVIQLGFDEIAIRMVVSEKPSQEDLMRIETDIKRVMGDECKVTVEFLDEIPKLPSGKYPYTRSMIAYQ
jgi:phenylacetate-CoA ligase